MEIQRKLRMLDKFILVATLSALVSSFTSVAFSGFTITGNYLFSTVAMVHGATIVSLLWKRGQLFDESL